MSLHTQIELMTVPQEFTRLCDALLTAEHGDDYLPIDDDSSDRGNDGYLKSEKRLFAAHCFKRVQNQGIEAAIRGKMVGDLGKAIALKNEGIWDIAAWAFLCNYKISEAIASRLMELGSDADIDVSWRGPHELAAGLQRHHTVLEQFPNLRVEEITERLSSIQALVEPLSPKTETPRSVQRTPRSAEEVQQLLILRPGGWEYLLFAGTLLIGMEELELKWHDHELRLGRGHRQHLDAQDAMARLTNAWDELKAILEPVNRVFESSAQEKAFGASGEPGNSIRVEHFAKHIVTAYEQMLDWSADLRNVDVPDSLENVYEIAASATDRSLQEIRAFIRDTVTQTDQIPAHTKKPDDAGTLLIKVTLTLTMDDAVLAAFTQELDSIRP